MRLPLCDKNFDTTEGIKNKSKECKQQLLSKCIKHRTDRGFREFRALNKLSAWLTAGKNCQLKTYL